MKHSKVTLIRLISFAFCALICAYVILAQNTILQIHKDGIVINSINVNDIDSITFETELIEVNSIILNTQQVNLKVGETYRLTATVLPANASVPTITWKSIFPDIVSVDDNGLLTAHSQGESLICAYAGNKSVSCSVYVTDLDSYNEGVVINGIRWSTRNVGEPGLFAETPESPGMLYQWNTRVGWSPYDRYTSIPEGSEWKTREIYGNYYVEHGWEYINNPCPEGWRIPTDTEFESLISSGYKEETRNGMKGLVFGNGNNTIFLPYAGKKSEFTENIISFGTGCTYWSDTPNPNTPGCVFGLSNYKTSPHVRTGYAWIHDAYSIRCVADEYIPVSCVSINKTSLNMQLCTYEQLSATVLPSNATNKRVVWSSSDKNIASVNGNTGSVYAVSPGTAIITATVDNITSSCVVYVNGTAQTGLSLNKSQIRLKVGESCNLVATITPPDATFNTVKWTSIDSSIATVDQNGKVTAIKEGSTYINASTKSMSTSCKVIVDKTGGDGGGNSSGGSDNVTGTTFTSAQLYYYGNLSSNTTYFRLSLFNLNDYNGLVIEGFCDKAYTFDDFILDTGTYTFSPTYGIPKTFIEGEFFGDPSTNGRYMGTYYYTPYGCVLFNGGTFTVSKSGETYTISTNLSGYSNASLNKTYTNLNFKFSGTLEKIDYF